MDKALKLLIIFFHTCLITHRTRCFTGGLAGSLAFTATLTVNSSSEPVAAYCFNMLTQLYPTLLLINYNGSSCPAQQGDNVK